jgi:hypothetical protein
MTDLRLKRMMELRDRDPDIRSMCSLVMLEEGATSLAHLLDIAPDTFDDLLATAVEIDETLADGL